MLISFRCAYICDQWVIVCVVLAVALGQTMPVLTRATSGFKSLLITLKVSLLIASFWVLTLGLVGRLVHTLFLECSKLRCLEIGLF